MGLISSAIGAYYYLRPVVMMYMTDDEAPGEEIVEFNFMTKATVVISAALVVAFGLFSAPALRAVQRAILAPAPAAVRPRRRRLP